LEALENKKPPAVVIPALTEVPGEEALTKLFFRGDIYQPRETVGPGELTVLTVNRPVEIALKDPTLQTTGRRLTYARHLTDGEHPLVARVLVNRVWMHHFGRGIVASPADFGFLGERPTHPELLDWLARNFMENGWSMKHLHRQIMLSTAYRQSSERTAALDAVDPDNRLLGRMSVRRLESEALRDSILHVSGRLSTKMYGPPVPVTPDLVGQVVIGVDNRDSAGRFRTTVIDIGDEVNRRSVYVQIRRTFPLSMLQTFDSADLEPNCESRNSSTVAPQSLLLMNNGFLIEQGRHFARRIAAEAGDDAVEQIRLAWRLVYAQDPADVDLLDARDFIARQTTWFLENPLPPPVSKSKNAPPPPPPLAPEFLALSSFCQALLSSSEFLYVD